MMSPAASANWRVRVSLDWATCENVRMKYAPEVNVTWGIRVNSQQDSIYHK